MTAYRVTRNSDPQPPKLPLLPMGREQERFWQLRREREKEKAK
jgi:hypothetical protein